MQHPLPSYTPSSLHSTTVKEDKVQMIEENTPKTEPNLSVNKTQTESVRANVGTEGKSKSAKKRVENPDQPALQMSATIQKSENQIKEPLLPVISASNENTSKEPDAEAVPAKQGIDWFSISISICIAATTFDYHQMHYLSFAARNTGGLYLVVAYLVFGIWLGFPVLNHYFHIAQYTQAGVTKVWGLYTEIFRCVGFAMAALVIVQLAQHVFYAAEILAFLYHILDDPMQVVRCKKGNPYDCHPSEIPEVLQDCCYSVVDSINCIKKHNVSHSMGQYCVNNVPDNVFLIAAPNLFKANYMWEQAQGFAYEHFVTAVLILLVVTSLAFLEVRIFSYAVAGTFCLALLMVIVWCIFMFVVGDLAKGWWMLVRVSEPEKIFTLEFVTTLGFLVFHMSSFKVSIISIASYHPEKTKYFWIATAIQLGLMLLNVVLLLADISMGSREVGGVIAGGVYHATNSHLAFRDVIPDFFSTFNGDSLGLWFYLYYVMAFLTQFGTVCSPFFVCFTLVRDQFPYAAAWWEKLCCIALSLGAIVVLLIVQLLNQDMSILAAITHIWPAILLSLGLVATVSIYGRLETLLDISTVQSDTYRSKHLLGPAMQSARLWTLGVATPHCVAVQALAVIPLYLMFSLTKYNSVTQLLAQFALILAPLFVLLAFLVNDVRDAIRENRPLWSLWYPSPDMPSYARIMPENFSIKNVSIEEEKKEN